MLVISPADTAGEDPHPIPAPCSDSGRHRHQGVTLLLEERVLVVGGVCCPRASVGSPYFSFCPCQDPGHSWHRLRPANAACCARAEAPEAGVRDPQ